MPSRSARATGLEIRPEFPGLLPAALTAGTVDGPPARRSPRDWMVDVTAFALATAGGLLLFFLQAGVETAADGLLLADLAAGVLLSIALWWRRRWPVQLAVLAALLSTFSAAGAIAAGILLFTVAVHRRVAVVWAVAALHLLAGITFVWLRPDPSLPVWAQMVINLPILAAVVAWGMFARARRQLVESLRERAARAESEQQLRIARARYLERVRIAREMHDVLAHRISLLSLHAGALEFRVDAQPREVARSAAVIRASAHQALQDLREVLGVLRAEGETEPSRQPQPSLADVARLVEESREAGMRVSLDCSLPDLAAVPVTIGRTGYRVVQEGLTNVRKHAPDVDTRVILSGGLGPGLSVEVRSRRPIAGSRATPIPGAGQGLTGLSERAAIAGGRLEHGRTPAGDFRLAAWLPWPAEELHGVRTRPAAPDPNAEGAA